MVIDRIGLDPGQEAISKGEMELGFFNISEVRPYVKFVGPVPAPLQKYTSYEAAATAKKWRSGLPTSRPGNVSLPEKPPPPAGS